MIKYVISLALLLGACGYCEDTLEPPPSTWEGAPLIKCAGSVSWGDYCIYQNDNCWYRLCSVDEWCAEEDWYQHSYSCTWE